MAELFSPSLASESTAKEINPGSLELGCLGLFKFYFRLRYLSCLSFSIMGNSKLFGIFLKEQFIKDRPGG